MASASIDGVMRALAEFSAATRLLALTLGGRQATPLLVEAFAGTEAVQEVGAWDVIALSTSAHIPPPSLLGQAAALDLALADGSRTRLSGEVCQAAMLGSDSGLARYRIRIAPWIWRLAHVRNCRVWQDKSVIDIVDAVFAAYQPAARWRWSDETSAFMADARLRSYCCQYRESDLDFVLRLLADEGLCWRVEETGEGHALVLFADSSQPGTTPEDPSSTAGGGIRYHGASSVEHSDTVQALQAQQRLHASLLTVLSSDDTSKRSVSANSPSHVRHHKLPELESYDTPGHGAYATIAEARRYADLQMEGREARGQQWSGRSTVRTLRAGTRLTVLGAPLRRLERTAALTVLRVHSIGINNMPPPARDALAELFGAISQLLEETVRAAPADFALAIEQASRTGYANCFEAIPAEQAWRPELPRSDGRAHVKPTAHGAQTAIVVGMDGSDSPHGADELCCDRLGRVRIRFHWQDSGSATCWVRVAQRSAGAGMGCQFLPRIGQEVLVQFLENDIDRPIVVGALYNGQGEGGIAPTPGGQRAAQGGGDASLFERAYDHATSGQGNLAGGNSPVWHGASPDSTGHRNGAAQWGIRSKEFGGSGYSQLLFDDTDGQGRVQLRCSHAATELNLGHLVHAVDNYRGSFRGLGVELRTDAYGAVRAGGGLLVSSYKINHGALARDPAGENAAGIGMVQRAVKMAEVFHQAAKTHQTVGLAAHSGSVKAGTSVVDAKAAPLEAMCAALAGNVEKRGFCDTPGMTGGETGETLSHMKKALIAIVANAGLGVTAGQNVQVVNGETIALISGKDLQLTGNGLVRIQSRQAIGILGGAVTADNDHFGVQLHSSRGTIDLQAQAGDMKIQARDDVRVISVNSEIDWAAAKSISVTTAGGASILIDSGNISIHCPGKISIKAGKKRLSEAAMIDYPLPTMPTTICAECLVKARNDAAPFILR